LGRLVNDDKPHEAILKWATLTHFYIAVIVYD